jgi:hypothetical protein
MEPIITIDDSDTLERIGTALIRAGGDLEPVRFAIDDGGLKFAVGRWTWSPPLGQVTP